MGSAERKPEEDRKTELLTPLREMVSVKKARGQLVGQEQIEKEKVLNVLKSEQGTYSSLKGSERKATALGEIIKGLESGFIGVNDLFQAAGVLGKETKTDNDGRSKGFKAFLRKFQR